MVSPVKSRLTHYETLGLTPAATPDEIAEAFAKKIRITISSPEEAVEHATRIYTAYETLKDPIKRRAYDAAIGEAAAKQKVEPFIGRKARESSEPGLEDASPGSTPRPKQPWRRRGAPTAAIEWPVPQKKSFQERLAVHVDAEALGAAPAPAKNPRQQAARGKKPAIASEALAAPGPAKNTRRRAGRRNKAATDRATLGGTPGPAKKPRRQARRAKKATFDRGGLRAAEQRKSAAGPGAAHPITDQLQGHRDRADQVRSVSARDEARGNPNLAAAGAGFIIAALGVMTLVVALVRGNYDQTPTEPHRPIAATDKQPPTSTAPAAEEQALTVDQTPSEAGGEASSSASVGQPNQPLIEGRQSYQQATGTQFRRNAGPKAAMIGSQQPAPKAAGAPPQQPVVGRATGTSPEQSVTRPAAVAPRQVATRQPAATPPQQVLYRTSPGARSKANTQDGAGGTVSLSVVGGDKVCKSLPSSWSRLPQRACLTTLEWKQVEEDLR